MNDVKVEFNVSINTDEIDALIKKYGPDKIGCIYRLTNNYCQRIIRDAKMMINKENRIDTGRLLNSFSSETAIGRGYVRGQVNAGTNYARFVHEGAKHKGSGAIVSHFVSFKTAPGLWLWLLRNEVVYRKTIESGKKGRGGKKAKKAWYFKSKKTGKEYPIDKYEGGISVKMKPLKFLEVPFFKYKEKYLEDIRKVIVE